MRLKFLSLSLVVFLAACGQTSGDRACTVPETQEENVATMAADLQSDDSDRWIVGFKSPGLTPSGTTVRKFGVTGLNFKMSRIDSETAVIHLQPGTDRAALRKMLLADDGVDFVEPDFKLTSAEIETQATAARTSTGFRQWGLEHINTPDAWKYTQGSSEVVVAVIDSGVDFRHPDLAGTRWTNSRERKNGKDDDGNGFVDDLYGWNFVEDNARPEPSSKNKNDFHGTHVAGIIAGKWNQAHGTAGVAPKVRLMALRFLNGEKSGYTSDAIKSIRYATDMGAKVINASFGSYRKSEAMQRELQRAQNHGVIIVAAAGNMGQNNDVLPFYPASYPLTNIISVTASTSKDQWLKGINYGTHSVDIAAPGFSILSTDQDLSYKTRSGSSMAAPFVTGVAALMLSLHQDLSIGQVRAGVLGRAQFVNQLKSRVSAGRRLNAREPLAALNKGVIPVAPVDDSLSTVECGGLE